jgi:ribosomal protein L16 Arg81 hydroxylase
VPPAAGFPEKAAAAQFLGGLRARGILQAGTRPTEPVIAKGVVAPDLFPTSKQIDAKLGRGLLRWPYVTVLHHGITPDIREFTHSRDVIGHQRDGFADQKKIRALMQRGVSVKLNAVSHWHRGIRELVRLIEADHPYAVASYIFWTPPGETGMLPHRDPGHVLAIQLEGRKRWQLFAEPENVRGTPGLDVDTTEMTHDFVVEPGDVVLLPHGYAHSVEAVDTESFHVTFTLSEPSLIDLLEGLREIAFENDRATFVEFDKIPMRERPAAVVESLAACVAGVQADRWVSKALELKRAKTG